MSYTNEQLADVLRDDADLWTGLDPEAAERAHAAVASGEYPLDVSTWTFVDGEEMAEGGVEEMLAALAPRLRRYGIELDVQLVNRGEPKVSDYVVAVNGSPRVCLHADEWDGDHAWEAASTRPLAWVNELLAATRTRHRAFIVCAGGNEGFAVLLDPSVSAAMRSSGLFDRNSRPELP